MAGLLYAGRVFVAPSSPKTRSAKTLRRGGGESVPTGLVWPSPEAEEKLREVGQRKTMENFLDFIVFFFMFLSLFLMVFGDF